MWECIKKHIINFEKDIEDGGWVVSIPSMPGCISQGDTFIEACLMILDAAIAWASVTIEDAYVE